MQRLEPRLGGQIHVREREADDVAGLDFGNEQDGVFRGSRLAQRLQLYAVVEKWSQNIRWNQRRVRLFPAAHLDLCDALQVAHLTLAHCDPRRTQFGWSLIGDNCYRSAVRPLAVNLLIDLPAEHPYHAASRTALQHAASHLGLDVDIRAVPTDTIGNVDRFATGRAAVFVGPGSPYRNQNAVHAVVRMARERGVPLVAT